MVLAFDDPRGLALHCTVMHFSNFVFIPLIYFYAACRCRRPYKSVIFIVFSLVCNYAEIVQASYVQ